MSKETKTKLYFIIQQIENIIRKPTLWHVFDEENGYEHFNLYASMARLTEHLNDVIYPKRLKTEEVERVFKSVFNSGLQFKVKKIETNEKTPFLLALKESLEQLSQFVPLTLVSEGSIGFQYLKADLTEVLGVISNYRKSEDEDQEFNYPWTMFTEDKVATLVEWAKKVASRSKRPIKLIVVDQEKDKLEWLREELKETDNIDLETQLITNDKGKTNHQEVYHQIISLIQETLKEEKQPLLVLNLDGVLIDTNKALEKLAYELARSA